MRTFLATFFRRARNAASNPAALRRPVGLPRALFHFLHPGLWETFFASLGVPVVLSSPTSRATLERADLISETEHCLQWDDPAIGIQWPLDGLSPELSAKDRAGKSLADCEPYA